MNPATRALLVDARRNPGRVLLGGLAVLVATVFAAGTLLLGGTLREGLVSGAETTPRAAAAVVSGVDDEAAARLAAAPGVTAATTHRTGFRQLGSGTARSWYVESDPMTGPLTRLPAPVEGTLPAADGQAVIGAATAERTGLRVGDRIGGILVTGIARLPGDGTNSLVTTENTARDLGAEPEAVVLAGTPDLGTLAALAPDATVRTGEQARADEVARAAGSVLAVMAGVSVFVAVALVAAVVVVASTFRIVLSRRRTQLALLRCVGAGRGQVTRAVLAEAAVTGLVAGVLGTGIALGLGQLVVALVPGTDLVLVVPPLGLLGCVLLAVVSTLVAAAVPALAAGRIPPVAALGTAATTDGGTPRQVVRIGVAVLAALAAAGLTRLGVGSPDPTTAIALVAAGGLAVFLVLVALGPLLIGAVARTVGVLVAATGAAGRLAVANARAVPRRTAATITVLALGVGLTSALLVAIAGANAHAEESLLRSFPAQVVVAEADPALTARLAAEPGLVVRPDRRGALVDPAPGVTEDAMREAVARAVGDAPVGVLYAGDLRKEVDSAVGTARLIGLGLVGMTLLVAVVGVGVTLLLSVTERTTETGLLRAVGLTRSGAAGMVAAEAALGGFTAALLGVALGSWFGLLGLDAAGLPRAGLPYGDLAALVTGVVAVAVLAAAAPAIRAARIPPVLALAVR